jgi:hypothetical protein
MAQISTANNNISPLGINIEEHALLIVRLSSPTILTPETSVACDLQDQANAALALIKSYKLIIPKGVPNVVELKTFGPTPEVAKGRGNTIFDLSKKPKPRSWRLALKGLKLNWRMLRIAWLRPRQTSQDQP